MYQRIFQFSWLKELPACSSGTLDKKQAIVDKVLNLFMTLRVGEVQALTTRLFICSLDFEVPILLAGTSFA